MSERKSRTFSWFDLLVALLSVICGFGMWVTADLIVRGYMESETPHLTQFQRRFHVLILQIESKSVDDELTATRAKLIEQRVALAGLDAEVAARRTKGKQNQPDVVAEKAKATALTVATLAGRLGTLEGSSAEKGELVDLAKERADEQYQAEVRYRELQRRAYTFGVAAVLAFMVLMLILAIAMATAYLAKLDAHPNLIAVVSGAALLLMFGYQTAAWPGAAGALIVILGYILLPRRRWFA